MMSYLGGKFKMRYQISAYINQLSPRVYLEPFCGFCWVGERVRARRRYFSDLNENIVLMWQALQQGWKPPTKLSEEEYDALKKQTQPSALRGFAGTAASFGGIWFSNYACNERKTNYAAVGARQLQRRMHGLRSAFFRYCDYREAMDKVHADVIYLDPPYAGVTSYAAAGAFDSAVFWDTVRHYSDGSRRILVSEYDAPKDFSKVLTGYSRMGLRSVTLERTDLHQPLREENLYEYQPPLGRRMVSFASLY